MKTKQSVTIPKMPIETWKQTKINAIRQGLKVHQYVIQLLDKAIKREV